MTGKRGHMINQKRTCLNFPHKRRRNSLFKVVDGSVRVEDLHDLKRQEGKLRKHKQQINSHENGGL